MSVSEPGKIITPWAESGLKNPIPPTANPATGRAGFDQGFSAINMTTKEAGGIPPFGQDFNGIFYEVTNILRYMQAGGQPTFDAALATAIGGYPKGAMVLGNDGTSVYKNIVDSNSSNPNSGGSGWAREDLILREALRRSYAEAGYNLVDGSFESGGTVSAATDVLLYGSQGKAYAWGGAFPKVVPPSSSPASTGGVGAGAWVDRTDVTLRAEFALPTGSSLVGFSGGSVDIFAARTAEDVLRGALRFDDFKGNTDDERWASLIAYMGTSVVTGIHVAFGARLHTFTVDTATLTKPFVFAGQGTRNTQMLFINCNGFRADLSAYGSRFTQSLVSGMSLIADSQNTKTGIYFRGFQTFSTHDPALILSRVSIFSKRGIDDGASTASEWATAVHLFDADEIHINDVYIAGASNNTNYDTVTSSKGIFADTCTGLRINRSAVMLCGSGIEITGQSEGFIGSGLTVVAVNNGIVFHDLVSPSNNHSITDTHVAAYTMGVELRKHTSTSLNPQAVFLSNLFILERGESASKPLYTAISAYMNRSFINNVTIQSNETTSPVRKGIIISNQSNTVSNISGFHCGELLRVDAVDTNYVFYNNLRGRGHVPVLLAGDVQYATGSGLGSAPTEYVTRADTFRTTDLQGRSQYESSAGRHLFGGGRHNSNVYLDFMTLAGGNAAFDGRILFNGGSASVDGQAVGYTYASIMRFAGNIGPVTPNNGTCGTVGSPWAGGFSQAAFTVTSDERAKTAPLEITDAMLDAWAEVDWVQYKYLDRVDVKGLDGARWHFGMIAQRAIEAFSRHGLDAADYGFLCYDEWESLDAVVDDDTGEEITPAIEAGNRYGIRYEEALALEAAYQRRRCDRIEARLKAAGL